MNITRYLQNAFYPFSSNRHNSKIESQFSEPERPIYGFYHVYAVNHWKDIVLEQFNDINKYGLLKATNKIYVSLVSTNIDSDIAFLKKAIGDKLQIIYIGKDPKVYEYPALEYLYNLSLESSTSFYAYYFHTKGSSNCADSLRWYAPQITTLGKLLSISADARRLMSYWNFQRWHLAVSVLQNGFADCYGTNYTLQLPTKQYYAGNFWWAKSELIRSRKPFSLEDKQWRYAAETWLLDGMHNNFYNTYRLNFGLHQISLPSYFFSPTFLVRIACKIGLYFKCQAWGGCMILHRIGTKIRNCFHLH